METHLDNTRQWSTNKHHNPYWTSLRHKYHNPYWTSPRHNQIKPLVLNFTETQPTTNYTELHRETTEHHNPYRTLLRQNHIPQPILNFTETQPHTATILYFTETHPNHNPYWTSLRHNHTPLPYWTSLRHNQIKLPVLNFTETQPHTTTHTERHLEDPLFIMTHFVCYSKWPEVKILKDLNFLAFKNMYTLTESSPLCFATGFVLHALAPMMKYT